MGTSCIWPSGSYKLQLMHVIPFTLHDMEHCLDIWLYACHCRKTRTPDDAALDLLGFRREIVLTYMTCYSQPRPTAGRLKGTVLPADCRVRKDVRSDHRDHYQKPFVTQRRCGVCHKNTRKGCHKCGVGLHDHCFEQWHGYV